MELSYYAENDPDFRDRVITARFVALQEKLAAAKIELTKAREASAKLRLKNVVEIGCDDSEYYSFWYQWNGSSWVLLSGMPAHC